MMCCKHPERMAAGACSYSGKFYCEEDLVELDGRMYAKDNMSRVLAEATEKAADKARQQSAASHQPMVFMNAGGGGGGSSSSSSSSAAASSGNGHGAIVVHGGIRHWLHITLSILTGGVWLIVYIPLLLFGGKKVTLIK